MPRTTPTSESPALAILASDRPPIRRPMRASSPSPRSAGAPGVTDWLTGIGTVALAAVTVVTPIATIYITITDRRNAEAARRRDRQQDSAQRLLEHVAGIVWYFRLIPGIYQWVTTDLLNNPRALGCLNAVRALETGMYADISGLGDARAAGQYRQLVSHVLAVAPGVDEGMGERTSKALRRSAVFVRESLQNLIEYGQSLPGRSRISAAMTARSAQSSRGWMLVRRSTATSCRSTSSSASLDAVERPSRTSQPHSRAKMR